jgi:hypothetical protein
MIRVWKCDYCYKVDVDPLKISQHEPSCSFNKINKKCYTCKFRTEEGYDEHIPGCEINQDVLNGELDGNCPGWVYEHIQEDRDNQINKILE